MTEYGRGGMKARFIGGSMDGRYATVADGNGHGNPPHVWLVPVPENPSYSLGIPQPALDELIDQPWPKTERYQLDGWYIRFSTESRTPIYAFKGVS